MLRQLAPSRAAEGRAYLPVRCTQIRHSRQNDFGVQRFAPLTLDQQLSLQLVAPKDSNVPEQQRGGPVCLLSVTGRRTTRGGPRVARHARYEANGCALHFACNVAIVGLHCGLFGQRGRPQWSKTSQGKQAAHATNLSLM